MTSLQEELISRYVDGDLDAAESARARILIETSPAARALFDQYSSVSQSLAEMPRYDIPVDMVDRLGPFLERNRGRRWALLRDVNDLGWWLAGAAVASVSGISAMLLLWPTGQAEPQTAGRSKLFTSAVDEAREPMVTAEEPHAKELVATVLKPAVELVKPGPGDAQNLEKAAKAETPVDKFVKSLSGVDRRHSIRLHVEAASKRVEDEVLRALTRFRGDGTEVMEVSPQPEVDATGLRYLALVPTRSVSGLVEQLRGQFGEQLELDLPEDLAWLRQNPGRLHPVKAGEAAAEEILDEELTRNNPQKVGPDGNALVADALARPLQRPRADATKGTLDEVMIQIRTDLLVPASPKTSTSKLKNRPQPENRK